jgi:hypothetical protein
MRVRLLRTSRFSTGFIWSQSVDGREPYRPIRVNSRRRGRSRQARTEDFSERIPGQGAVAKTDQVMVFAREGLPTVPSTPAGSGS